jgi:hypothetical protein
MYNVMLCDVNSVGGQVQSCFQGCSFLLAGMFRDGSSRAQLCLHWDSSPLSISCRSACRKTYYWLHRRSYLFTGWNRFTSEIVSSCLQGGMKSQVLMFHPCSGCFWADGNEVCICLQRHSQFLSVILQPGGWGVPNLLYWGVALLAERHGFIGSEVPIYQQK